MDRAPTLTSSHLMNLLPRRRVSTTVGGSSCSVWTPGLAPAMAGLGAGRGPREPRRGPTAPLLPPRAPARPAPTPRRQRPPASQSVPDGPENRRGPGGAGRGRSHSGTAPSHPRRDRPPLLAAPPGGRGGDCSQRGDGAEAILDRDASLGGLSWTGPGWGKGAWRQGSVDSAAVGTGCRGRY